MNKRCVKSLQAVMLFHKGRYEMDITRKTSLQFVFFFSYSCYYMLIVI